MSTTASRTSAKDDVQDIKRFLEQPLSETLCPQSKADGGKRRIPTCALIMMTIVASVGLLAYFAFPQHSAEGPNPWRTRSIALPDGIGVAYHGDRPIDSFFGKFERRVEIETIWSSGEIWLPFTAHGGSTRADVAFHEVDAEDNTSGPWLELNGQTGDFLIDLRAVAVFSLYRMDGRLCAVPLAKDKYDVRRYPAGTGCQKRQSAAGRTVDITELSETWKSRHLGLLDRRPRFVTGESLNATDRIDFYVNTDEGQRQGNRVKKRVTI